LHGMGRDGRGDRPATVRDPAAYIRLPVPKIEAGKAQDRNAALALCEKRYFIFALEQTLNQHHRGHHMNSLQAASEKSF